MDIGKSIKDGVSKSIKLLVYNSVRARIWVVDIQWVSVRISEKDSVIVSIRSVYGDR